MVNSLWLTSWYPSEASLQNGDFIQRHAHAVSSFSNVYVLYITAHKKDAATSKQQANLSEEIIYYNKKNNSILGKALSLYQYIRLYKKSISNYIHTKGKPDIIHVHVSMRAGLLALWAKRKYHIPYIVTEHWTLFTKERKDNFSKQNFLFKYYTKRIFQKASAVLPVSDNLGKNIQQMVVDVPYIKVPNVVSDAFYYEEKMQAGKPFIFAHVSSLNKLKNPQGILRAYAKVLTHHPHVLLKIIGGNYEAVKNYAQHLNIPNDKIIFTGSVSNEKVAKELKDANVFVLFSQSENSPCVIAESLCSGLPVIATNVGGIPEMLHENNAILIAPNDEQALFLAMISMTKNYLNYDRKKISEQNTPLYNYDIIGKTITRLYLKIIEQNS